MGFKTTGLIVVEYAIPFQSAKRKFSEVTPNWRNSLKMTNVLPDLVHMQVLGTFHSHPQFDKNRGVAKLSDCDEESLEAGNIEIVVAINNKKIKCPWTETQYGLSGTVGKYHIAIAGFYKKTSDQKIMNYRIICPYAVGFNYAFQE